MINPYLVLGVPQSANRAQVDAAYRTLALRYENNASKIQEINDAYDSIIMNLASNDNSGSFKRRANPFTGKKSSYDSSYTGGSSYGEYDDIRARINEGRFEDAQVLLDGIPLSSRDAQWHYLKGTLLRQKGWLDDAAEHFSKAASMEPSNSAYRAAFDEINRQRSGGYNTSRAKRVRRTSMCDDDCCDLCCGLMVLDSCCECMGGDLIECC
ncbi:MAG: molecular chaperone DnaJ [Clostridiales bacterium]|nr:molecular chaperone DnaJ [Clostridiales bacterium]